MSDAPPPIPPPMPAQPLNYGGPVAPDAGAVPVNAVARAASIVSIVRFILTSAVLAVLVMIFLFVIPRLEATYADFGVKLPWITQLVLDISRFMQTPLGWVTAAFVVGVVALMIAVLPIRGRWLRMVALFVLTLLTIAMALAILLPFLHLIENISSGKR